MASTQQFCLRWNNHQSTLVSVFDHLLESGTLVDCTLAAEGQFLKAHKVVLSACSPYLEALLSQHYEKHPIIILKDVTFHELKSMLDYMYRGEVNISQEQLTTFLKAAESLQIKGLTDCGAIAESRELERPCEMEQVRDFNSIDRSVGIPISKRIDNVRKQIPIIPVVRSPLVGLPPNFIANLPLVADNRKSNKYPLPVSQEMNSGSPNTSHNREGSVSPTIKRKRQCLPQIAQSEEAKINSKPVENNFEENNQNCIKSSNNKDCRESPSTNLSNTVLPNSVVQENKQVKDKSQVKCDVMTSEVKTENVDFVDEVLNDDSVDDHLMVDEEEEMDEMDLSRPGTSNQTNSHVAAIPWHVAGEGNGEDLLLASQQDSQGVRKHSSLVPSWEAWSALYPSVPNLLRGALSGEENKGVECPKCGRHYKLKSSLRNHQKWECGKEPQFQCPYCNYRAKQKMHVARHIERMHREKLDVLESMHDRSIKEESPALFQQDIA